MRQKKVSIAIRSVEAVKAEWAAALRGKIRSIQEPDSIVFRSSTAMAKVLSPIKHGAGNRRNRKEASALEAILGGPLTLGLVLEALRRGEGVSRFRFAKRLGLSVGRLGSIEAGRAHVSAEQAARFARQLGHPVEVFVRLALQDQVRDGGLKLRVDVEVA